MAKRKAQVGSQTIQSSAHDEYSIVMQFPARSEWVRVARLATAGVAARMEFPYDDIEDIKLAVAEACNNAILHGRPDAGSKQSASSKQTTRTRVSLVTIRWTILPDALQIDVTDEGRLDGRGLPLRAAKTARTLGESPELDDLPESGMGLILIQSLMDEVEHESDPRGGTTLRMTKRAPVPMTIERESLAEENSPTHVAPVASRSSRRAASPATK